MASAYRFLGVRWESKEARNEIQPKVAGGLRENESAKRPGHVFHFADRCFSRVSGLSVPWLAETLPMTRIFVSALLPSAFSVPPPPAFGGADRKKRRGKGVWVSTCSPVRVSADGTVRWFHPRLVSPSASSPARGPRACHRQPASHPRKNN